MFNFDFYNPVHVVFGQDRLSELDKLIPSDSKVMITFGGQSAKKYGTIDKVSKALGDRTIIEFGGIEVNPEYDTLIKAVEIAKTEKVDFLLAVGGGSVMDGTKFIALASKYDGDYTKLLTHGFAPVPAKAALPLGCVVTLPATGSEMNMGGVITYQQQKRPVMSPLTFPKFSFLDPDLTLTLPNEQIANGVADAFVHVIEQYLTFPVDARIQDRMAEGILQTLIEVGEETYRNKDNLAARKNFIWSATTALNGWIATGVPQDWTTHMIGHEMTALFGIAHGRTLAIMLPYVLRERTEQKRAKLLQFAERVWYITDGSDDEKITQAINKTEAFFNSLDIATNLTHYGIDDSGIDSIISNMEKLGLTALSETHDLSLDVVRKILVSAK